MMVMMLLISIFTILLYYEKPSLLKLVIAAIISSMAILIKPFCLFLIFGAFISIAIFKNGLWKTIFNFKVILFSVVCLIPTIIYYVYGVFADVGFLRDFTQISFLPHLVLYPYFWKDWLMMIGFVVG